MQIKLIIGLVKRTRSGRLDILLDATPVLANRYSISGKTQKEVREKLQTISVAINNGEYFEPAKMTISQWLDACTADYMISNRIEDQPKGWSSILTE